MGWIGGGSGGAVSSVFGRTGTVVAAAGDYTGVAVGGTADAIAALALTNAMVAANAAIAKSKLAALAIVDADVAANAAIAKSKLANLDVVNADIDAAAAIAISKLADPGAGKVIGSNSGAAAVFPPGYEISYTQITSPVNVVSTTEASGTTIISPGAITFDGGLVLLEFWAPYVIPPHVVGDAITINLFEGATQITRLIQLAAASTSPGFTPEIARYRFTPSAGAHTYTITAYVDITTGTPGVGAGSGGTGGCAPCFLRFTKV